MHGSVFERVGGGPVDALVRLVGVLVVEGFVVHVVVSEDVVPGDTHQALHRVQRLEEGEVVTHEIPERHPERGLGPDQLRDRVAREVGELLGRVWLRVGEHDHLEAVRFGPAL